MYRDTSNWDDRHCPTGEFPPPLPYSFLYTDQLQSPTIFFSTNSTRSLMPSSGSSSVGCCTDGRWEGPKGRWEGPEGRWEGPEGRWEGPGMSARTFFHGRLVYVRTLIIVFLSKWNISSRVTSPVVFKSYMLKQTTAIGREVNVEVTLPNP